MCLDWSAARVLNIPILEVNSLVVTEVVRSTTSSDRTKALEDDAILTLFLPNYDVTVGKSAATGRTRSLKVNFRILFH